MSLLCETRVVDKWMGNHQWCITPSLWWKWVVTMRTDVQGTTFTNSLGSEIFHTSRSVKGDLLYFFFHFFCHHCSIKTKGLEVKVKSTPAETLISYKNHCSWNASSPVPPLILWLCDITLCHYVTMLRYYHNFASWLVWRVRIDVGTAALSLNIMYITLWHDLRLKT